MQKDSLCVLEIRISNKKKRQRQTYIEGNK